MRASELMVGDWVINSIYNTNEKVVLLNDDFVDTDSSDDIKLDDIYPIPLTPEILDKNGWTDDESDIYHISDTFGTTEMFYNEDLGEWDLDILLDSKFNKRVHLDIKYVHELQHALRLCYIEKEILL